MPAQQKQKHRDLISAYNIHFDGLLDQEEWPAAHLQTFSNIKKLGRREFDHYCGSVTTDLDDNPWREQTKRRAERIAALAKRCRKGRKNEAGWRLSLESEILARFTVEVACRKCRARLWRSEVEASEITLDQTSGSLEERQKKRVPCTCHSESNRAEIPEQGLNMLFDDRAEEPIVHNPYLQSAMKKIQKPDRIYGLRMTKRLDRLLRWSEDKRPEAGGKVIGDSIQSTPFRSDGDEPLIFPFLALEAKSEKSSDGFSNIETQTAFTIRSLLELQEGLRQANGKDSLWRSGPLVWFLANRGEEWRVSVAYIQSIDCVKYYRVVDLWGGRITSTDGALQLLLIVDYIFDWARDIYREAIIAELRQLALGNTASLGNDSDIFSLDDRVNFWRQMHHRLQEQSDSEDNNFREPSEPVIAIKEDPLRNLDSPHGVLRDAAYIWSRFIALHITKDNLPLIMNSMETEEDVQKMAKKILRCLRRSWRVSLNALDTLELEWTGINRATMDLYMPRDMFFVTVTVSAYISPNWEQTRELCYLAVSEESTKLLFKYAGLENDNYLHTTDHPWVKDDVFVSAFKAYQSIAVEDNLLAAISRACVSTELYPHEKIRKISEDCERGRRWVALAEELENNSKRRFDAVILPDFTTIPRRLVLSIYNPHGDLRNEPSLSFFRTSNRLDQQRRPAETPIESLWPSLPAKTISIGQEDIIFVGSRNPSNFPNYAELCLFIMDASSVRNCFDKVIRELWHCAIQFQTMRMNTEPGWGFGWNMTNIQMHEDDYVDNKRKLLLHLSELENLGIKGKDKEAERRETMAHKGRRRMPSAIPLEPFSPNEILEIVRLSHEQENKGFSDSDFVLSTTSAGSDLSDELQVESSSNESVEALFSHIPKRNDYGRGSKLQNRFRPRESKLLELVTESAETGDDKRPGKKDKGKGILKPPQITAPTLAHRDHFPKTVLDNTGSDLAFSSSVAAAAVGLPKRSWDNEGLAIASSSAGPSKRPRQKEHTKFNTDYLNDMELSILLESGILEG